MQTFVQRALNNLEPTTLLADSGREWIFIKRYRVWQARRKVFLYPENWVVPELRDDKTPLFEDLENALLSEAITEENVECAYIRYLEDLDQIARLHIAGVHWEEELDQDNRIRGRHLHVVGFIPGKPNRHFYRKWVNEAYWTAWEELPFQIESGDVLITMHDRRLMLFWVKALEKANDPEDIPVPAPADTFTPPKPDKYLQIRLGYSLREKNEWAAPRETEEVWDDNFHEKRARVQENDPRWIFLESYKTSDESRDLVVELGWWVGEDFRVLNSKGEPKASILKPFYLIRGGFQLNRCDQTFRKTKFRERFALSQFPNFGIREYCANGTGFNDLPSPQFSLARGQALVSQVDGLPVSTGARFPLLDTKFLDCTFGDRAICAPTTFEVVTTKDRDFFSNTPFIYQDQVRTFFVIPHRSFDPGGTRATRPALDGVADGLGFRADAIPPSSTPDSAVPTQLPAFEAVPATSEVSFLDVLQVAAGGALAHRPSGHSIDNRALPRRDWGEFEFRPFYHPFVCKVMAQLRQFGLDGLFHPPRRSDGTVSDLARQLKENIIFERDCDESELCGSYCPTKLVLDPLPQENFDFLESGAYSVYNWEVFFHAPMLIVDRLMAEQRFQEALRWIQFIFDPTDSSDAPSPERFWNIKPFFTQSGAPDSILDQLLALAGAGDDAASAERRRQTIQQIRRWTDDPFNPHLLARLRPAAYQRFVVMKYLDLLIAWGDSLFQQDTIETVNEALQLYVLAAQILGPRPVEVPPLNVEDRTFADLESEFDEFGNALVEIENLFPNQGDLGDPPQGGVTGEDFSAVSLYFCIPRNDKLLGYWDTVGDRLFKIRNCLNLAGIRRSLPLFEPPIDPALLVRAAAQGIDLGAALSDLGAPLPAYKFRTMVQLAKDVVNDVKGLGQSLLSALEKKDAEALAVLRANHEVRLTSSMRTALELAITEADENITALDRSADVVEDRRAHFQGLLDEDRNTFEEAQLDNLAAARRREKAAGTMRTLAAALRLVPQFSVGFAGVGGSPTATVGFGGGNLAENVNMLAEWTRTRAVLLSSDGQTAGIKGGFERLKEDWELQVDQAALDLERLAQDRLAAEARMDIAKHRLREHEIQLENSEEARDFLESKYTNEELYGWMSREISRVYFQAYQLARETAKRAERSYQYQLAAQDASFIEAGYWDSRRKGLLAGDMLMHDLRRMETSFFANDRRELELTKRVSLALLDPVALLKLKESGSTQINLPEVLFDLDHPGHYLRRIKSVRLTIPAVTGPFTNVNCKLTLVSSFTRPEPSLTDDPVQDRISAVQSVATSTGQDDPGLFNENLQDERFLPFEGKGVVDSQWTLELPHKLRQFDYDSITDVVLTISYTARDGGEPLREAVVGTNGDNLRAAVEALPRIADVHGTGLVRMFSARQEFPNAWNRFVNQPESGIHTLQMELSEGRFPNRLDPGGQLTVNTAAVVAVAPKGGEAPVATDVVTLTEPGGASSTLSLADALQLGPRVTASSEAGTSTEVGSGDDQWTVTIAESVLTANPLEDLLLFVTYEVTP